MKKFFILVCLAHSMSLFAGEQQLIAQVVDATLVRGLSDGATTRLSDQLGVAALQGRLTAVTTGLTAAQAEQSRLHTALAAQIEDEAALRRSIAQGVKAEFNAMPRVVEGEDGEVQVESEERTRAEGLVTLTRSVATDVLCSGDVPDALVFNLHKAFQFEKLTKSMQGLVALSKENMKIIFFQGVLLAVYATIRYKIWA